MNENIKHIRNGLARVGQLYTQSKSTDRLSLQEREALSQALGYAVKNLPKGKRIALNRLYDGMERILGRELTDYEVVFTFTLLAQEGLLSTETEKGTTPIHLEDSEKVIV